MHKINNKNNNNKKNKKHKIMIKFNKMLYNNKIK